VASFPSDELAERRARRDARDVEPADGLSGPGADARLAAAHHEVAVLTARLGQTVAERDRVAGLAASRRADLEAAREHAGALRALVRHGEAELARVREQLAVRAASEASLRVQATGLHARIHALRAHAAAHDARAAELGGVVAELTATAGAAREDVERHLGARAAAEDAVAAAERRACALQEELAGVRAELAALHAARDRTLGAEERARAARAAEWAALRAGGERLRASAPSPAKPPSPDLAVGLARAAERLRGQAGRADEDPPAAHALPAPAPRAIAPAIDPPVAARAAPARAPVHRGALRRRLRRLLTGRA
jgi:hypothetical protein